MFSVEELKSRPLPGSPDQFGCTAASVAWATGLLGESLTPDDVDALSRREAGKPTYTMGEIRIGQWLLRQGYTWHYVHSKKFNGHRAIFGDPTIDPASFEALDWSADDVREGIDLFADPNTYASSRYREVTVWNMRRAVAKVLRLGGVILGSVKSELTDGHSVVLAGRFEPNRTSLFYPYENNGSQLRWPEIPAIARDIAVPQPVESFFALSRWRK